MSAAAARRHFHRHGRSEGRWPNAELFLLDLEAREGVPPPDFDWATYLSLNPDIAATHPSQWQATAHFLSHGWREQRRYVNAPSPAEEPVAGTSVRVTQSTLERLRKTLHAALGEGLDDEFIRKIHLAQRAAAGSGALAAALMDPILIARHRLMHAHEAFDFAQSNVQLRALFRVAFSVEGARGSRQGERDALNRIRAKAIGASVAMAADPRLPSFTLLMMAASATLTDYALDKPPKEEIFEALSRFFIIQVPRLDLERFVTPHQRALLRAPWRDGVPLAACMLDKIVGRSPSAHNGPKERVKAFWDEDVWRAGLAYIMSGEQLEAAQLRVEAHGSDDRLLGPPFLLSSSVTVDPGWSERQAAEAWLRAFVLEGLERERFSQLVVGPSVVSHVACGGRPITVQPLASFGHGRKPLRPGVPVSFAWDGGAQHLVGPGWSHAETEGRWTTSVSAAIAITLDPSDVGPLDLFIALAPGRGVGRTVSLTWNGSLVAVLRLASEHFTTLNCYLGRSHRSGVATNILNVNVERTYASDADPRLLGVFVRDFILVQR